MIMGFLSDAHGNALGLTRCLDVLRRMNAERIYFLGDSIGYLPDEEGVLSRLESIDALCLRGNHEEMLLGFLPFTAGQDAVYGLTAARSRLRPERAAWIEEWPRRQEFVVEGARVLLVHGSPLDPVSGYVYRDSDLSVFSDLPYDVVLLGHTHRPFIRRLAGMTIVNVGSCGLPRDVGNLASCAVYDTVTRTAEILRVEFDVDELLAIMDGRIDDAVSACLKRANAGEIVGRRVDV